MPIAEMRSDDAPVQRLPEQRKLDQVKQRRLGCDCGAVDARMVVRCSG
jgi:hypothetical protein